jgi:uncharacterized protein YhjY with autotransporter beta-barrel domain
MRATRYVLLLCVGVLLLAQAMTARAQVSIAGITFAPTTIPTGGTSRLTIALGNSTTGAATLLQPLTDVFPPGLKAVSIGAGTCTTAGVATGTGGGSVTYGADFSIPAGGCTVVVNVTATATSTTTYYTNTIAAGALQTTLGNNPAAASGTLAVQSAVTVPNVIGLSEVAASNALRAAGLVVGTITQAPGPANVPFNAIFAQNPTAGTTQPAGTAVSLQISTGPGNATNLNSPLTSVPNFVAPEQMSVAAALERVCAALQAPGVNPTREQANLLANCLAIIDTHGGGADAAGLKSTLDAISGRQSTAQQRTGVHFAGTQFTNIGTRLAQLRQGMTGGVSLSGLDMGLPSASGLGPFLAFLEDITGFHGLSQIGAPGADAPRGGGAGDDSDSSSRFSRLGFFINGNVRRGSQDNTLNESGFDFRSSGITAGVDYRLTNSLILGLAFGHMNGKTDFSDASGRLDSRNNSISLYGTYYREDLYVDMIGTFGHVSYGASRTTSFQIDANTPESPTNCAGTTCSIDTAGSTGARQLAFATNVGYSFQRRGLTFGPDVALNYTRMDVNGFTENDPNSSGMNLIFGNQIGESLLLKAGGHASYAINTRFGVLMPQARAHYIHEFKDAQRALSVHFAQDPTADDPNGPVSNFVVFTDRPDRGYFDWSAGVVAQFPYGISAFLDYSAIAGASNLHTHELNFGVRIERLGN